METPSGDLVYHFTPAEMTGSQHLSDIWTRQRSSYSARFVETRTAEFSSTPLALLSVGPKPVEPVLKKQHLSINKASVLVVRISGHHGYRARSAPGSPTCRHELADLNEVKGFFGCFSKAPHVGSDTFISTSAEKVQQWGKKHLTSFIPVRHCGVKKTCVL